MLKKTILLSLLCALGVMPDLCAQGVLKESFDTDEFPKVSFVWHEYNPQVLNISDFQSFTENGQSLDFTVQNIPRDVGADEVRYVVFLWEDLAYHGANLYEFSKKTLEGFISSAGLGENDRINVSVYGRRELNEDSYLRDLTNGFVSDKSDALSTINGYIRNKKLYSSYPNRADIFPAVSEAIEKLRNEGEGVKSVIVLTAGYPLDNSSASSDMSARLLAEKYHVPVYFLQYGRDHGYSDKLSSFTPLTYGTFQCFADINQKNNISKATDALVQIFSSLSDRYHGQDYLITYNSKAKRGDDDCVVSFNVNGFDYNVQMHPPVRSLRAFVRNHPLLASFILLTILGLLALLIVFYIRRRILDDRRFKRLDEQDKANEENAINAINAVSDARESFDRKIQAIKADKERSREKTLDDIMAQKSLFPRLVCNVAGDSINYTVKTATTSIGRDSSNDLVISDARVSRRHAKLMFTGYLFEIADSGSTNGIYLNGVKVSGSAAVRDGDKLDLGGVLITIYM